MDCRQCQNASGVPPIPGDYTSYYTESPPNSPSLCRSKAGELDSPTPPNTEGSKITVKACTPKGSIG
jgi:hypothetical protein